MKKILLIILTVFLFAYSARLCYNICRYVGASPSGKAAAFGAAIRRFESFRPSFCGEAGTRYYETLVVRSAMDEEPSSTRSQQPPPRGDTKPGSPLTPDGREKVLAFSHLMEVKWPSKL